MSEKGKPWKHRPRYEKHAPATLDWPAIAPQRDVRLQCTKKKAYSDPGLARKIAAQAPEVPGMKVRTYTCPHCTRIHVGHYEAEG